MATAEIIKESVPTIDESKSNVNIQNNLHFVQNIDIQGLDRLGQNNSQLANRAMQLYENQFDHAKSMDIKIVELEAIEQKLRAFLSNCKNYKNIRFLELF